MCEGGGDSRLTFSQLHKRDAVPVKRKVVLKLLKNAGKVSVKCESYPWKIQNNCQKLFVRELCFFTGKNTAVCSVLVTCKVTKKSFDSCNYNCKTRVS